MAESKAEQVEAAIVTRLGTIVGDGGSTYWFTPDVVKRTHAVETSMLDSSRNVIYLLSPDRKSEFRRTSSGVGCIVRGTAFLTLTLLSKFTPETEDPLRATSTIRWTIQERMEQDVRKKLREDPKLGGVSTDLDLTDSEEGAEETFLEGWALAFMRLQVMYHYAQETP